jgi:hypothetical protein
MKTCYVTGCAGEMVDLGLCRVHADVLLYPFALPEAERAAAVAAVRKAVRAYGRAQKAKAVAAA